jgi:hypothetical protein
MPDAEWCYSHHPDYAEERQRRASKAGRTGGRGRPASELSEVKTLLADLINRVLKAEGAEDLETGRAAVANQLINTRLRAIEVERKVKETDELAERIEALERTSEAGGGKRWGA